jgi:hypothetical protein
MSLPLLHDFDLYMLYLTYIGLLMKAELIEYLKQDIRGKYIMEIRVWKVADKRYLGGLKYSLIFIEKSLAERY